MDLYNFDSKYRLRGYLTIAGVDEAGRGPWAGPVVAAAVILPENTALDGLNDSKKLSSLQRDKLFDKISASALGIGTGIVGNEVIDSSNILRATFLAMRGAVSCLKNSFDIVLVDGSLIIPQALFRQEAIIGGDAKSASIAAASIIAKVTRDRLMAEYSREFPQYSFHKHKGYGTKEHLRALTEFGPCAIHRKTFKPVHKFFCPPALGVENSDEK